MKCIDTHIHIWNFDRTSYSWLEGNTTILNRNYLIGELEPQIKRAGVSEGVLVQAANTEQETTYMLEVATQTPWLKGVVGWLPLMKPAETENILISGYAKHQLLKGVRHLIHDEPDPAWLLQSSVVDSLQLLAKAGIPYDLVGVVNDHLETAIKLVNNVPDLRIVLDHLNQPPISKKARFGRWGELITELANHPNVYAKISGLGTTANKGSEWDVEDILPYVAFAIEKFGVDRCFCGGDWPVSLLAGDYVRTWGIFRKTLNSLVSENDGNVILYDNAKRFYNL